MTVAGGGGGGGGSSASSGVGGGNGCNFMPMGDSIDTLSLCTENGERIGVDCRAREA